MKLELEKTYSPLLFSLWRIAFGLYLLFYTIVTFPYRGELYAPEGMISTPSMNYLLGHLPNPLTVLHTEPVLNVIFLVLAVSSICIMIGFGRRVAALITYVLSAMLFGLNPLTSDPSIPYVGLLLLFLTVIPEGEPYSVRKRIERHSDNSRPHWYMPSAVYWGAWVVLGISLTMSGIDRYLSPVWVDGTAMYHLLNMPITRDNFFVELMRLEPMWMYKAQTWLAVAAYTISLPLILFRRTRVFAWLMWVSMFVYVMFTIDLTQVVFGMLLYYAFLFDIRWLHSASPLTSRISRKIRHIRWSRRASLISAVILLFVVAACFVIRGVPRTVTIESAPIALLDSHEHGKTDAVNDTGHHQESFSETFIAPHDMWIESLSFKMRNAPAAVLHHAILINLSANPHACSAYPGAELWAMGQDQMHHPSVSFEDPYRLFVKKGDRLKLFLSVHNPLPPVGPGGTYRDVSAKLTLHTRLTLRSEDHLPIAFRILHLGDTPCPTDQAPHVFTVPGRTARHVTKSPEHEQSGAAVTFDKYTTVVYMGGHLHGWQGGVSLSVKKNGTIVQTFETSLSETVPYRYDTPHGRTLLQFGAGDLLSIESVSRNPNAFPIRGLMGMFGMYYTVQR